MRHRIRPGPDPDFPVLGFGERLTFPDPHGVPGKEPAFYGANLSPGVLLAAYEQGYFPWYGTGEPLWWWSPDPRFGLAPDECHVSASMAKVMRRGTFELRTDTSFREVMQNCSSVKRPGQDGTWITNEMIDAYEVLHGAGIAHSVETWQDGVLVGGLYGVQVGRVFCGESMFATVSNASKAAFISLCAILVHLGYGHLDSQVHTDHVSTLGGKELARGIYLDTLHKSLADPVPAGTWKEFGDLVGLTEATRA